MRRVLVLAYVFPPLGGGGVYRTLKHVKFLRRHGYQSLVITARGRWYPPRDESLLDEVPEGTHVVAAPEIPLARVRALALNPLHRLRLSGALSYIGWPDAYAGWIPGAVWSALRAARRHPPDVIYSTSPPMSAHVVGLLVSRILRLPWVVDFRDAWTLNSQSDGASPLLRQANMRLEDAVVRQATRVVIADETVEVRGAPRRTLIHNGVDPDDLPTESTRNDSVFRLTYVGTLYGARDAENVFTALKSLIRRGEIERDKLELRLVGSDFRGAATGSDIDVLPVVSTGYVDHRRALAEMAAADALLLYQPPSWRGASGKAYEYLATGRPILCVAPVDGFATRLVLELGAGECAQPDDPAGIEEAIATLYRRWRGGGLGVNTAVQHAALKRFSREQQAERLAGVLDAAVEERLR
jgi:glycosyltransferase involved in cell wall biosynthesis